MRKFKRITLKDVFTKGMVDLDFTAKGWVRSVRRGKKFSFIVINDGTVQANLQIVVDSNLDNYDEISSMLTGTSISVTGKLVASQGKGQTVEMQAISVSVIGTVDENYPLQKKSTSLEFLREKAHLRPRTNIFGAVFRVRHALSFATHRFFNDLGFYYLNSPIITGTDAEGAGEMFKVSVLDHADPPMTDKGKVDYGQDYFGKDASLSVSGQLAGECFASGMNAVYTFGPTFRSENSNTSRHLAEFWMIEPEVAFADLNDISDLAIDYLKYLISHVLEECQEEMKLLTERAKENKDFDLLQSLINVRDSEFVKITYTNAIDILSLAGIKFEFEPVWGKELQTEHEKYLTEKHFKLPVIVTDYPKDAKAFYMKQNDDGKTIAGMDLLVPGVGEIIGGSQREDNFEKLSRRMDELSMNKDELWWYLELRKFGSVPHSGFGLGFERMVMYVTGMNNIRDVIPFPRTPQSLEF